MRNIYIDLSSDNPLQQPKIFGGYEGEHNETFLCVKLPKRMIETECTGYRFDFQISKDYKTSSPLIPTSELNEDILSFYLPEQLTNVGDLFFNVAAITLDGDIVSSIGKTSGVFIRINNSPNGKNVFLDPNGYKDELLTMIDGRIAEYLEGVSYVGEETEQGGEIFNSYDGDLLNKATGEGAHAEGRGTEAGRNAHAEGKNTKALGNASHAEGNTTTATGDMGSHAEGLKSIANGIASHAEGNETLADADNSHAEGASTQALAPCSHAEGEHTIAKAIHSHAEGFYAEANGIASHAEGYQTKANGYYSHAEGANTQANGDMSHASGLGTVAGYNNQFVAGKYNKNKEDTVFEVGNGSDGNNRSNAFEVYKDGHAEVQAVGVSDNSVVTKGYVSNVIGNIEVVLDNIIAIQENLIGGASV